MSTKIKYIIEDIDEIINISKYFYYDKKYTSHIKNILKMKKKLENGEIRKVLKDYNDEVDEYE